MRKKGGHDILIEDIKRRFERSLVKFFKNYLCLADQWIIFNNANDHPEIIAKKQNARIEIKDKKLFAEILSKIGEK
ncbi:MAG: hypothetical protein HQL23_03605 [Candidatus Omnitrophica bacterium]|nr:hypothetical protein [Candidatus Omnitrophota bacterium]